MTIEEQPLPPFDVVIPPESFHQEPDAITYDEYSLIRRAFARIPHPLRRISTAVGEFLDGMGPQ